MSQLPLKKTSAEVLSFSIDCSQKLGADTIVSIDAVAVDPVTAPPLVIGTPSVNSAPTQLKNPVTGAAYSVPAGQCIALPVSGGHTFKSRKAMPYTVSVTFLTSAGETLQVVVPFLVDDYPDG